MKLDSFSVSGAEKKKIYLKFNTETNADSCLFGKLAQRESLVK